MSISQQFSKRFRRLLLRSLSTELDHLKLNQARSWLQQQASLGSPNIHDYEFKVFSQWGDDGIIQHLVNHVAIENTSFIEFGVEDFQESNCRFLMINNNWSGFIMDGSEKKMNKTRRQDYYWQHDLTAKAAFITRENINELLDSSGFGENPGIISVDIDGMDYWVFCEIRHRPALFILEYNAVLGCERTLTVPYTADFHRTGAHYSNLYYGASLPALNDAAVSKGYSLVGCNSAGNNAFFVRTDLLDSASASVKALPVADAFVDSKFRESRGADGKLSYARGEQRLAVIKGLEVIDTSTGKSTTL